MAALTRDAVRDLAYPNDYRPQNYRVAGGVQLFRSGIAVLVNGHVRPAADTAGERVVGLVDYYVDNRVGFDGTQRAVIQRGVLAWFETSGTQALTQADVGQTAYVLDDNTVVKQAGTTNGVEAGEVLDFRTRGNVSEVFIQFAR